MILKSESKRRNKPKTCFIAAPSGVDISAIKHALIKRGLEPIVPFELPVAGISIAEHLSNAIKSADLFIAVLDARYQNSNVYYEIGFAHALEKRSLILASPSISDLPSDVSEHLYLRTDSTNSEAIGFALDRALSVQPQKRKPEKSNVSLSRPIGKLADKFLQLLDERSETMTEMQAEQILIDVLRASDIKVVAQSPSTIESGADLAIWADELTPWVGNPLLIDLKGGILDEEAARRMAYHASSFIASTNSKWVLLVAVNSAPDLADFISPIPRVIFITLFELIRRMRRKSFGQLIRDLRNRQLHGGQL